MFQQEQCDERAVLLEQLAYLLDHVSSGECPEKLVSVESFFACSACRTWQRVRPILKELFEDAKSMKAGA